MQSNSLTKNASRPNSVYSKSASRANLTGQPDQADLLKLLGKNCDKTQILQLLSQLAQDRKKSMQPGDSQSQPKDSRSNASDNRNAVASNNSFTEVNKESQN